MIKLSRSQTEKICIAQADASDIDELYEIERLSFPPNKAASREAFEYRLNTFPQWFFKAEAGGKIVGLADGSSSHRPYITDDLYENGGAYDETGENLLVYGLAVHPEYRHSGVAHLLIDHILASAKAAGKKHISLTCKKALIGFYESIGFTCRGTSKSVIGSETNYDMEMYLI